MNARSYFTAAWFMLFHYTCAFIAITSQLSSVIEVLTVILKTAIV